MISLCLALSGEESLDHLCRVLLFLKKHYNTKSVLDPRDSEVDASEF